MRNLTVGLALGLLVGGLASYVLNGQPPEIQTVPTATSVVPVAPSATVVTVTAVPTSLTSASPTPTPTNTATGVVVATKAATEEQDAPAPTSAPTTAPTSPPPAPTQSCGWGNDKYGEWTTDHDSTEEQDLGPDSRWVGQDSKVEDGVQYWRMVWQNWECD